MTQGLILFAHGARDPAWAAPFEAVAALVRARQPSWLVRLAYLEFMSPPLAEAATALVHAGCGRIVVRPMFLGTGGHVRRDLPRLLEELRHAHPGVDFVLQEAIGENPSVHAAMADAIAAAPTTLRPGSAT
jgi:sirohydrochlorin cobaltochelatase